jgi:hypothetical protein
VALGPAGASGPTYLGGLPNQKAVASTVPGNGDVNPYGVAVVHRSIGMEVQGEVLISNFNDSGNFQGTGSTIVEVAHDGTVTQFAKLTPSMLNGSCPGGVGLTTALSILSDGYVVVGSLPTNAGTLEPGARGCLIVLTPTGQPAFTIANAEINGPWDMTAVNYGAVDLVFVTNVLNGTRAAKGATVDRGTVLRLIVRTAGAGAPVVMNQAVIGSGFPERTDPNALVVGPTGVGLGPDNDTLYVADSVDNAITMIPDAAIRTSSDGMGAVLSAGGHLNDPLGLTMAPNGDVLTANGLDGNIVETTEAGHQVAKRLVDHNPQPGPDRGNGALFGLAVGGGGNLWFVDDDNNNLNLLSS